MNGEPRFGLRELALGVAGVILVVGAIGATVSAIRGHSIPGGIAVAYYIAGALAILVGSAPTGGVSFLRGRFTRRKPTGSGSYALQGILFGALLIGIGVLFDLAF